MTDIVVSITYSQDKKHQPIFFITGNQYQNYKVRSLLHKFIFIQILYIHLKKLVYCKRTDLF